MIDVNTSDVALLDYKRRKIFDLKKYLNYENDNSINYFYEFLKKLNDCKDEGSIEDLYEVGKIYLKKQQYLFDKKEELDNYASVKDAIINRHINDAIDELNLLDLSSNDFDKKEKSILNVVMRKIDLRKTIINQVENQKKLFNNNDLNNNTENFMRTKILGEYYKYKQDKSFSFTLPFIQQKLNQLVNTKNITIKEFDSILLVYKPLFEEQRKKDLKKAQRKHELLNDKLLPDFENSCVFPEEDYFEFRKELNDISSFGGFSTFENNFIKEEINKMLNKLGVVLAAYEFTMEEQSKDFKVPKKIKEYIKRCISIEERLKDINKNIKDVNKIEISPDYFIDYREFCYKIHSLESCVNIDNLSFNNGINIDALETILNTKKVSSNKKK